MVKHLACDRGLLALLLGLVMAPAGGFCGAAPEATVPAVPWAEVIPLGSTGEPVVFEVKDPKTPLLWKSSTEGLVLVCFGGEEVALSCEQSYVSANATLPLVLQKGVRITGVVRIGKVVAPGAHVSLVPQNLRARRRELFLPLSRDARQGKMVREVSGDAAGRFKTPQLAAGDYVFQVQTRDGRILQREVKVPRPEAFRTGNPPAVPPDPVLDIGEITFPEGVTMQAWVTARDGRPLRGAHVSVHQGPPFEVGQNFKAVTDAEGKAKVAGLDPALEIGFQCDADGFVPLQETREAPPPVLPCALDPVARLDGTVIDGDGKPVANATVSARDFGRLRTTGADGKFSIPEIEPAHYDLVIAAPGFRVERQAVDIAPGEAKSLRIELEPGQAVRGLVRDARSQEPVAGASIVSTDPPGAVAATSDGEGAFNFTTDDEGTFTLEVTAEGYPKTPVKVDPQLVATLAEKDEPLVIELKEGGRVRVSVWDEEMDEPCQACSVYLIGGATLVTDARGEALSEPLAEGEYNVALERLQSRGIQVRVQGNAQQRVQVIAGKITPLRLGEPRPTLEVRFHPEVPDGWDLFAESPTGPRDAERLPDRGFKVKKPAGGPVVLRLGKQNSFLWVDQAVIPADDTTPTLDLPLPQGTVHGSLVKDQSPVPGRMVEIFSAANGTRRAYTTTNGGGSFLIPFLPAGVYAVVVDGQALQSFSLEEDADRDLGALKLPERPSGKARR